MKLSSKFKDVNHIEPTAGESKNDSNKLIKNEIIFDKFNYKSIDSTTYERCICSCDYTASRSYLYRFKHNYRYNCIRYHFRKKCKHRSNMMTKSTLEQRPSVVKILNKSTNRCKSNERNPTKIKFKNECDPLSTELSNESSRSSMENEKTSLIKNSKNELIKSVSSTPALSRDHHYLKNVIRVNQNNKFTIRCLLMFLIQLLISQLLFVSNNQVSALDTCLEHCTCIYSKNKFIADCSALALDNLPVVSRSFNFYISI